MALTLTVLLKNIFIFFRWGQKKYNNKTLPQFNLYFNYFLQVYLLSNRNDIHPWTCDINFFVPRRSWQQPLCSASVNSTAQVCPNRGDNRNLVTVMTVRRSAIAAAFLLLFVFAIQYRHRRKIKRCLTLAAACLKEWPGKQRHRHTVDARRSPSDVQICQDGPTVGFGVSRLSFPSVFFSSRFIFHVLEIKLRQLDSFFFF